MSRESRIVRGLTTNIARTAPEATDVRLRGRTYAIPFDFVWQSSLDIVRKLRGWTLIDADDHDGIIKAEARTLLMRYIDDVVIRVTLDHNAQTRVDMESRSRKGFADFGTNTRRIARFFRRLDKAVAARHSTRVSGTAA